MPRDDGHFLYRGNFDRWKVDLRNIIGSIPSLGVCIAELHARLCIRYG